jgi:hypothetical protein
VKDIQYNIFGSHSSTDYDLAVKVDSIPIIVEAHDLCKKYNDYFFYKLPEKKINCNLVVVSDGILVDCFKGTIDELNNAILYTYGLHRQEFECFVTRAVKRDVEVKIARCLRGLLSMYSRTDLRTDIKNALRGNIREQLNVLEKIDFVNMVPVGKKESMEDIYKMFAFQLGQTFGIIDGKELYTKESIALTYPFLMDFIFRNKNSNFNVFKECSESLTNIVYSKYQHILDKNETVLTI